MGKQVDRYVDRYRWIGDVSYTFKDPLKLTIISLTLALFKNGSQVL